jgi:hypothetical protein
MIRSEDGRPARPCGGGDGDLRSTPCLARLGGRLLAAFDQADLADPGEDRTLCNRRSKRAIRVTASAAIMAASAVMADDAWRGVGLEGDQAPRGAGGLGAGLRQALQAAAAGRAGPGARDRRRRRPGRPLCRSGRSVGEQGHARPGGWRAAPARPGRSCRARRRAGPGCGRSTQTSGLLLELQQRPAAGCGPGRRRRLPRLT